MINNLIPSPRYKAVQIFTYFTYVFFIFFFFFGYLGIVTLSNLHRFGEQTNYLLNISVSDGVFTNFATLQVDLLSINRHSPTFDKVIYDAEVVENAPAGTLVIQLNATDVDQDDFGHMTYEIPSEAALHLFKIDSRTGAISTTKPLDREARKFYDVPVVAFDAGGRSGHTMVQIKVADINDNRPMFLLAEYTANIPANFSIDKPFLTVLQLD